MAPAPLPPLSRCGHLSLPSLLCSEHGSRGGECGSDGVVAGSGLSTATLLHPLVMATPAMLRPPPSSPYDVDLAKRWATTTVPVGWSPAAADPASSTPSMAPAAPEQRQRWWQLVDGLGGPVDGLSGPIHGLFSFFFFI